ncbi:MAG: hypothetical protein ACK4TA_09260 [Saprospiraceae bacterium]
MKKSLFFLLLCMYCFTSNAQSVFPSYEDQPVWKILENGWHNSGKKEYHIKLKNDTILCGNKYNPALAINYPKSGDTSVLGYYRQEAQRVYFRLYNEPCDTLTEYTIYDFSLHTGDSLYIGHDITALVMGERYENYCGILRKELDIRYIQYGQVHRGFGKWIEGIGEIQNPFMTPFQVGGPYYSSSGVNLLSTKNNILFSYDGAECLSTKVSNTTDPYKKAHIQVNPILVHDKIRLIHYFNERIIL